MKITPTRIADVLLLEPEVFEDQRGTFFESFNQQAFERAIGAVIHFVQDNHSQSGKGVLRGLHFQLPPRAQGKLIRVVQGEVFDVAVDIRVNSPSFGRWTGDILSAENRRQKWIPAGLAHGFLVLSESAELVYKTTDYYAPELARTLCWNDPGLAIAWPLAGAQPVLSQKDQHGLSLSEVQLMQSL